MHIFILFFLVLTFLYHILVTTVGYGIFGGHAPNIPAVVRDGIWFGVIGIYALWNHKIIISLIKQSWKLWSAIFVLILFSVVVSYFLGKSPADMLIGIKYGFLYLLIFLSALVAGSKLSDQQRDCLIKRGLRIGSSAIVLGFLWQGAKLLWPDFFFHIGYGRLDDFHFGAHPPLYYLTGLGGTLRRQGIFSGPNNYGYFLVAFLPLFLSEISYTLRSKKRLHRGLGRGMLLTWFIAIALTLSRTAYIGTIIVLVLMYGSWIKRHWKIALGIGLFLFGSLVGLSILKGSSTLAHIAAKFSSLGYIFLHPLGLGLGSSGPAIHHNGSILPENYFIQICLDIGIGGFLLWLGVLWLFFKQTKYSPFTIGFIALLGMGMFLHVFEDSMVNYAFFILRGITLTSQSKKI